MRDASGQGTVEWVGLVAAIAIALTLGSAFVEREYVGRAITRQYARALCIVRGGDCERDREPCVVASDRDDTDIGVTVVFVDLGGGKVGLIERRSDGTVLVTRTDRDAIGASVQAGAEGRVRIGRFDAAVGGEVTASMLARREGGRSWLVRSVEEARALLDDDDDAPEPAYTYGQVGTVFSGSVGVQADEVVGLSGGLTVDRTSGTRIDRRTGRRTIYVRARGEQTVNAVLGDREHRLAGAEQGGEEVYAIEVDASGRPLELRVVATSERLPEIARSFSRELAARRGRSYETTAHLDLTDPANLQAARVLLDDLRRPSTRTLPAAVARLRDRVEAQGTIEVRVLARDASGTPLEASGTLGVVRLGGRYVHTRERTRLLAAGSRGLDGQWLPRGDCVTPRAR